jgi:hypothetical protein
MKKIITFIIVLVFLVSLVSAASSTYSNSETSQLSFGAKFLSILGISGGSSDSPDNTPTPANKADNGDNNNNNNNEFGSEKLELGQSIFGTFDFIPPGDVEAIACSDTDHGRNFAIGGIVSGRISLDSEIKDYPDRCLPNGKTLVETYCNRWTGYVQFNRVVCNRGCIETVNGAECNVPPFCLDTDRIANKYLKGALIMFRSTDSDEYGSVAELMASDSIEIIQDVCVSNTRVKQFSCSISGITDYIYNELDCDENQKCVDGVCKDMVQFGEDEGLNQEMVQGGINPLDKLVDTKSSFVDVRGITESQTGESIDIMDGQSATVNGIQVSFSSNTNTIQFAQQFSEGLHNLEGNEIEIGDTAIETFESGTLAPIESTKTLALTPTQTTTFEKETAPTTISKTSTLSSSISVSTLKL